MTTYTKETALYNTNAIANDIDDAENAYKTVITEVGTSGIQLHPSGQDGSPEHPIEDYTLIDNNGMEVFDGGTSVAAFGGNGIRVGQNDSSSNRIIIDDDSFDVYHGIMQIAHFGYGEGNNGNNGVSSAPYYSMGNRLYPTNTFSTSSTYGEHVVTLYNGEPYISKRAITSPGAWNPSDWDKLYGNYSFAEGSGNVASGSNSHAEGSLTKALYLAAHAEGAYCTADDYGAHAEGVYSKALGHSSHAEGNYALARGSASHAGGYLTTAAYDYQTVIGCCNDNKSTNLFEIGNGDEGDDVYSNALELDWSGNLEIAGGLTAGNDCAIDGDLDISGAFNGFDMTAVSKTTYSGSSGATAISQVFETVNTGFSISTVYVAKWGPMCTIQIEFARTSGAINSTNTFEIGKLATGFRPAYFVGGGNNSFAACISSAGTFAARNVSPSNVAANTTVRVGFTYILG